ncbi:hypothetical protein ACIP98_42460, partial [Streptomyces sp. NPDC088354]
MAYDSRVPFQDLSKRLHELSDLIEQSVGVVGRSLPPAAARPYVQSMRLFIDDGGVNYVRELARQLDDVADGRVQISMQILEAKAQIIAELVRLLIELTIIAAMAFFTGGSAAADSAAAQARSRVTLLTILDRLLKLSHKMPSLSEAFDEAFTTFIVRLGMIVFAPQGRRPGGFDWKQIIQDGIFGGLTGIFHGALDPVMKRIGKRLDWHGDGPGGGPRPVHVKDVPRDVTSKIDRPPRPGERIVRVGGAVVGDSFVDGASESVAEVFINGLFNGRWAFSFSTFHGAVVSSIAMGGLFIAAGDLGHKFG